MNSEKKKHRKISEETDFFAQRDKAIRRRSHLSTVFLRPVYQYTALENNTVEKLHENDYLK